MNYFKFDLNSVNTFVSIFDKFAEVKCNCFLVGMNSMKEKWDFSVFTKELEIVFDTMPVCLVNKVDAQDQSFLYHLIKPCFYFFIFVRRKYLLWFVCKTNYLSHKIKYISNYYVKWWAGKRMWANLLFCAWQHLQFDAITKMTKFISELKWDEQKNIK